MSCTVIDLKDNTNKYPKIRILARTKTFPFIEPQLDEFLTKKNKNESVFKSITSFFAQNQHRCFLLFRLAMKQKPVDKTLILLFQSFLS